MISTHLLPEATFAALAGGGGDATAIRLLRDAQLSKHLMLLHAITEAAASPAPGPAAFRAAYRVLAEIQAIDPCAGTWLFGLPHLGGWAHDCMIHLEQGAAPDLAYFSCLVAAAAVRIGAPFELDLPVRDGRVMLPGLGSIEIMEQSSWVRLSCDGERVTAGDHLAANWRLLVPDDGSGAAVPHWSGALVIHAVADGLAWDVLLETKDRYLDRYTLQMTTALTDDAFKRWQDCVQSSWQVLVRHHRWAAEPLAKGLSVIVPLTPRSENDLVSATTPAAFGAIATSPPPDAVTLAETLIHEFSHVKLCGLMDMVPLIESAGEKVYAPWRQDPRPVGGLMQGVYAHLGIARFWQRQQHAETDPDDILRAQAQFARWKPTIGLAVGRLLETGCLTPAGVRFAGLLRAQGQLLDSEVVPDGAAEIAGEAALDHWLTWQLRHVTVDAKETAMLATAYRHDEPRSKPLPKVWVEEETRKVDSAMRSRLLTMRYLAPARYRALCADEFLPLSEPDRLLVGRRTESAVRAYRDWIAASTDPQPAAWIGLALAVHQLPGSPLQQAFASLLPIMFEVYARLDDGSDPLTLAAWLA